MLVRRAAIAGATGLASGGGQNAGGDEQKKLDVVSNDLLKGFLARSGVVRVLASEEVCTGVCLCPPSPAGGVGVHSKGDVDFATRQRNVAKKRRLRGLNANLPRSAGRLWSMHEYNFVPRKYTSTYCIVKSSGAFFPLGVLWSDSSDSLQLEGSQRGAWSVCYLSSLMLYAMLSVEQGMSQQSLAVRYQHELTQLHSARKSWQCR